MSVSVLMYHSISDISHVLCVPPSVFRAQLDAVEASGQEVISLGAVAEWIAGRRDLPQRAIAFTFDDGYSDFATVAAPALQEHGWTATVFLPTGRIGKSAAWNGMAAPAQQLMTWDQVAELARAGFEFGAHSVSHHNLNRLSPDQADQEIRQSFEDIEAHLEQKPTCFAPPYGSANRRVRRLVREYAKVSVSTRLGRVMRSSSPYDIPRIEMNYFRDLRRWRRYLDGRAEAYLLIRRGLRAVRSLPASIR